MPTCLWCRCSRGSSSSCHRHSARRSVSPTCLVTLALALALALTLIFTLTLTLALTLTLTLTLTLGFGESEHDPYRQQLVHPLI